MYMVYCYDYPRPALTVDCLIYCYEQSLSWLLLVKRKNPPFEHCWALPGGFIDMNELLVEAAARELREETGLSGIALKQFGIFDKPGRDPRGRTISFVFWGFAGNCKPAISGRSDALEAKWIELEKLPLLAFDHREIIDQARSFLKI